MQTWWLVDEYVDGWCSWLVLAVVSSGSAEQVWVLVLCCDGR